MCGAGECEDLLEDYQCHCPDGYKEVETPEEKTCARVICEPLDAVDNADTTPGSAMTEKHSFEDVVRFECEQGYTLDATAGGTDFFTVACQADRTFTAPKECKPVEC